MRLGRQAQPWLAGQGLSIPSRTCSFEDCANEAGNRHLEREKTSARGAIVCCRFPEPFPISFAARAWLPRPRSLLLGARGVGRADQVLKLDVLPWHPYNRAPRFRIRAEWRLATVGNDGTQEELCTGLGTTIHSRGFDHAPRLGGGTPEEEAKQGTDERVDECSTSRPAPGFA